MGKSYLFLGVVLLAATSIAMAEEKAGIALLSDTKITETSVEAPAGWEDKPNMGSLQSEIDEQTAKNDELRKHIAELEKAVEEKGLSTKEISKQIKELKSQVADLEEQKAQSQ